MNNGKVYIGSMNIRGEWAKCPNEFKKVNVTSCQSKTSKYRIAFSPMTKIEGGYKNFFCFENYWQSGKVYEGLNNKLDIDKQKKWWLTAEKGYRRYPLGKNKKVLYAKFDHIDDNLLYIPSRKLVYIPEYYNLIKDNEILKNLKQEIINGKNIVIYDFDGPRSDLGIPILEEVTLNFLINKVNDEKFPFGHGYIIAAALLNLKPNNYII